MKKISLLFNLFKKYVLYLPFLFALPLFFHKLGQSSLVSFDEAWYASIAHNIIKSGDFINLTFNSKIFLDHPPFGFWLIALAMKAFGVNELGARLAPAVCGFLSLVLVFLLGRKLFNPLVGIFSALALVSSPWFLFRARSGNLDTILVMLFLAVVYFSFKSLESKKFLVPLSLSLSFLVLTKTAVGFTVIPAVLLVFFLQKGFKPKDFVSPVLLFMLTTGGWFAYTFIANPDYRNVFLRIGLPGVGAGADTAANLDLFKNYLHASVGKWFWPGVISTLASLALLKRKFLVLSAFVLSFSFLFVFSSRTQIWHLIPLHPFLILSYMGFSFALIEMFSFRRKLLFVLGAGVFVLVNSYYATLQIRRNWYEFVDIERFVSDEAILSSKAKEIGGDLYIDGDFLPSAVFYSEKFVIQTSTDTLKPALEKEGSFPVITYQWRLDSLGIPESKYEIIKADRDKILIRKI